jgi:hypothetical protein
LIFLAFRELCERLLKYAFLSVQVLTEDFTSGLLGLALPLEFVAENCGLLREEVPVILEG